MSIIYKFNETATNVITASLTVATAMAFPIEKFGVKVNSTQSSTSTSTSSVRLRISGGGITYQSETITLPNGGEPEYVEFNVNTTFPANTTLTVALTRTRANLYGDSSVTDTSYFFGAQSVVKWNCYFVLDSQGVAWKIPSGGGYPELVNNPRRDFVDWERNQNDYPLNKTVWKLDSNNLGYPWIWGYIEVVPFAGGIVYVKTANGAVAHGLYVKGQGTAAPLKWAVKT